MRQKEKRIGIVALAFLILLCSGIYIAYRLHPESFIGKDEIITRGEYAAILANEISLDISNSEKEPPSFSGPLKKPDSYFRFYINLQHCI